jgi:opacity protein-like surface antigen
MFEVQRQLFLKEVVKGYLSLYTARDAANKELFFIQEGDSAVLFLRENILPGMLHAYLKDCPGLFVDRNTSGRKKYRYELSSMIDLVKAYNRCVRPDEPFQVRNEPEKNDVSLGIKAGWGANNFSYQKHVKYSRYYAQNFDTGPAVIAGVFMHIPFSTNWAIQPEILFAPVTASLVRPGVTTRYEEHTYFRINYLQAPITVRYTISRKRLKPYVYAGPGLHYALTSKAEFFVKPTDANTRLSHVRLPVDRFSAGYAAGAGIESSVDSRLKLFFETGYNQLFTSTFTVSAWQLRAGIRL